jgi:hypothetical protein
MRSIVLVLGAVVLASPLFAAEPSPSEVSLAYNQYRAAVCGNPCPPGFTDTQAQIRLLKEYCRNGGTGINNCDQVSHWDQLPALTYDHQQRAWIAESSIEQRTEFDVNGTPTVDLGRRKKVVVVVTNTNPLLYAATAGKIELKPIDQFSDLQALATLLGSNAAAILQVEASEQAALGIVGTSGSVLKDAADALLMAGNQFVAGQRLADCVTLSVQAATNFVQAVELGRSDTYPPDLPQCRNQSPSGSAVRALTPTLGEARDTLARRCPELPASVEALLAIEPPTEAAVRAAVARYDAATGTPDCAAWNANPNVVAELERLVVRRIRQTLAMPNSDLPTLYRDLRSTQGADVQRLTAAAKGVKAAEEALAKLVASLPALGKAAENLDIFRERLLQNIAGKVVPCSGGATPPCVPQTAVATFFVVPGGPTGVTRWEFVHSRPIKIAADSPYTADVASRRSGVETSYNLRSTVASIFDIGVSLTRTDLQSPTFGAVRDDRNTPPTPNNLADDTLVVGIVDQESQSGKLALMLNIVPLRLWDFPKFVQPLGIQVGAAVDTSKPALFWGLSYGFGKYVRVGWGETSQRVATLRSETPLGTPILNAGEIRKRQKYKNGKYWSLMISIRALRLFTR